MKKLKVIILLGFFTLLRPLSVFAEESMDTESIKADSALNQRIKIERATRYQSFVLTPHKPNYILPIAYNNKPNNIPQDVSVDGELDKNEVKFQFSMKFPIVENFFGEQGSIQFAYTNLSFWQAYNMDIFGRMTIIKLDNSD